ncbi:MAG: GDP-mannose 4,6-dehydratase [candidate division Zixibacteria bacterium]|jgi:GDP-4-dehydro-6-deoxy-D-mannose reductase|nr:GDP-mannose 4,6-dehydratase [candidate division Zixibacteria bacterium]
MKGRSAFITGIAGFAGSYLAEELLGNGWRVAGAVYKNEPLTNLSAIRKQVTLYRLDILNADRCREVIGKVEPEYVFHLAALASVGQSFSKERATYRINFEGTLNLLQAAREHGGVKRLLFVSSSDCYGPVRPRNKTLTEKQPFNPVSPYGISKVGAEHLVQYYHRQYGLPVIIARAFNHSGPRQAESFVIPAFARQIALIEAARQEPVIKVGDLSARRDIADVRDIVRGYRLLAEKGRPGEAYHLCSGRAVSVKRILELLLKKATKSISVEVDPARLRKTEIPVMRGSYDKARKQVGFEPRYRLEQTLQDTLEFWRASV